MEWKPFDMEKVEESRMIVNDIFIHISKMGEAQINRCLGNLNWRHQESAMACVSKKSLLWKKQI